MEVFAGATHTNLLPITRIQYEDTTIEIDNGPVCKALCNKLNDIMRANPTESRWITPFE